MADKIFRIFKTTEQQSISDISQVASMDCQSLKSISQGMFEIFFSAVKAAVFKRVSVQNTR
jgi:hypothetical protein